MMRLFLPALVMIPTLSGCALLYPPPLSMFVLPFVEPSSDSLSPPSHAALVRDHQSSLSRLRVGVLTNPNRARWQSPVDGELVDERADENWLLASFLGDANLFGEVLAVDSLDDSRADFVISCSVECLYSIEIDSWMYTFNCVTLGLGFLLGYPYQDPSAFYVIQAVFYDRRGGAPQIVGASMGTNRKEWYCDNIYWRPDFYDRDSLDALFELVLHDFLTCSGCLEG
ncbi:MAG: hypothetical protein U1E76_14460 [Planctomycetota bacterium]